MSEKIEEWINVDQAAEFFGLGGCGQKVGLNFPHRICEKCIQKNSTIKHLKSMKKQNL